ncbi:hypothetical protein MI149_29405 (plasmid) [Mycolicibacterium crocinum]|nr:MULTISPECIES: hypothetical protein [Mycolicibacterium]ULN44804.1 hypothetical protein MI149_29405 [Mycolicibacterium crocinum]
MNTIPGMTYAGAALGVATAAWFVVGFDSHPDGVGQSLQYLSGFFALAIATLAISATVVAVCGGWIADFEE